MPAILSICDDAPLNTTRKQVLETCGARVTTTDSSAAPLLLANQCFDLVLLCHTIEGPDMRRLVEMARRCSPNAALLLFDGPTCPAVFHGGEIDHLESFLGPATLVARVRQILEAVSRKTVASVPAEQRTALGSA